MGNLSLIAQDSSATKKGDTVVLEGQEHIKLSLSGTEKFKKGDLNGGMEDFKKSVEIDPGYSKGYFNLGLAAYKMDMFEEAAHSFEKVIELDSSIKQAFYYLPYCYKGTGEIDKAKNAFEHAIKLFPQNRDLYYYLALMHSHDHNKEAELKVLDQLLEKYPNEYKAIMNRALLLNDLQRFKGALEDLSHAIKINDQDPESRLLRGIININLGYIEEGCVDLKRAKELGDKSAAILELIPMHCGE